MYVKLLKQFKNNFLEHYLLPLLLWEARWPHG